MNPASILAMLLLLATTAQAAQLQQPSPIDPREKLLWFFRHDGPVSLDTAIDELERKLNLRIFKGPRLSAERTPAPISLTNPVSPTFQHDALEIARAVLKANDLGLFPMTPKGGRDRYLIERVAPAPGSRCEGSYIPIEALRRDGSRSVSAFASFQTDSPRVWRSLRTLAEVTHAVGLFESIRAVIVSGEATHVRRIGELLRAIEQSATSPFDFALVVIPVHTPVEEILRELEEALGR